MQRAPVSSSTVAAVGYDLFARILEIEFTSGSIYRYFEVEQDICEDFLTAPSKGKYFNTEIRGAYRFVQMR